jgi:GNAT superfamily N-acetyltransferase
VNAAFKVERFFIDSDRIDPGKVREMLRTGKYLFIDRVCVRGAARPACLFRAGVDPMRQGQGLGRKMVEEAESYARAAGCEFMDLRIVNLRTELPPFYRRLGYVETGTEPFAADAEPAVPFHNDVETARNCSRSGSVLDRQRDLGE